MRVRNGEPLFRLVRGEVWRDRPRTSGRGEVTSKAVGAVALNQIPVGHHDRRRTPARHGFDRCKDVPGPYAALEGPGAGALDRHAIHHRIAVWQADLDKIDTVRLAVSCERRNGAQGEVDGGVTD